jgi:hypothetical protein
VLEIVTDQLVWLYLMHLAAGVAAVLVALCSRRVEPGIVALAALFVGLYVVAAPSPDPVGDGPDPSGNASLILTGVVLLALLVAFRWPAPAGGHEDGPGTNG